MHNSTEDSDLEVSPDDMLIQQRDDDTYSEQSFQNPDSASDDFAQTITITVSYGSSQYDLPVYPHSSFGDVKEAFVQETGLEANELKILFRGVEKDDDEQLQVAGVEDSSEIVLMENPNERVEEVEESPELTEEMAKAFAAVIKVTEEVDELSDRVVALEVAVNEGTEVSVKEFDMTAELLMRQLLKLDGIVADGEARLMRKAEVRRVQNLQETVDTLKSEWSNQSKAAAVRSKY